MSPRAARRPSTTAVNPLVEGRVPLPGPPFYLTPHVGAPLFAPENHENVGLIIRQLTGEVLSGSYPTSEAFLSLLRQTGLVSLWFFLKVILGSEGPYSDLNDGLHREICNFRQSRWCMEAGARAAILVPRGFLKSTIMTHGGLTWEGTRNPDLTAVIANATSAKADSFRGVVKTNIETIGLYRALYPEMIPGPAAKRWNEKEIVFPGRRRHRPEPSINAIGVGAAGEGFHYDLLQADDLVGLDDLDAEHMGNMNMLAKVQWFKTNRRALLRSQTRSRIIYCATWFSPDDPSSLIVEDCRLFLGYRCEEFEEHPAGTWTVYNRLGIEDGVEVCPEVVTAKSLSDQMEDDFWGAMTQSMNRPSKTGLIEFAGSTVKRASLWWSEAEQRYYVVKGEGDPNFDLDPVRRLPLSAFDVVMAIDPASTDRDMSAKTSRTAIVIWAVDSDGDAVLLWRRVGYFAPLQWFDYIFEGAKRFNGAVRCCVVESAAMQKVLAPLLTQEASHRSFPLYFKPMPALGDKAARIRMKIGPMLGRGKIYAVTGEDVELRQELKVFPNSRWRMDTLDACEKALSEAHPPEAPDEVEATREAEVMNTNEMSAVTGY